MNKFFEFHKYLDRFNNRPYYRGTWEPLKMEAFRLLPFQYQKVDDSAFTMYQVINGVDTDITELFFDDNKITSWTHTGSGAFSSTGSLITSWVMAAGADITETFTLTAGVEYYFQIQGDFNGGASVEIEIEYASNPIYTLSAVDASVEFTFTPVNTGSHDITLYCENALGSITTAKTLLSTTILDFDSGTNDFVSYNGSVLYGMVTNGACYFKIDNGSNEYYSEDCQVGCVNALSDKFGGGVTDVGKSFDLDDGDAANSGTFKINKGDVVTIYFNALLNDSRDLDLTLKMSGVADVAMADNNIGDVNYYTGTALESGTAYIHLSNESGVDYTITNYDIERGYSDQCIKISASSTVDYAGIKYSGGWEQWMFKSANVRRSTSPQVTIIGDDPNGILIKEKSITSTKYKSNLKVTEPEFDALMTAIAGTVTITDQSGKEFTCNNMDINEPSWSQGNGIAEISFIDNVSIHTLNNTAL